MTAVRILCLLLGALAALTLGALTRAPALAAPSCHAPAGPASHAPQQPEKPTKPMACCVACVTAATPAPPTRTPLVLPAPVQEVAVAVLPAGRRPGPDPHPPRQTNA